MAQQEQNLQRLNVLSRERRPNGKQRVNGADSNGSSVGINDRQFLITGLTVEQVQALREEALKEKQALEQPRRKRPTSLRALAIPQSQRDSLRKQSLPVGEPESRRSMAQPSVELVGLRNGATGVHYIDNGRSRLFFFVPGSQPDLMAFQHLSEAGELVGQERQDLAFVADGQRRMVQLASVAPMVSRG